MPPLFFLLSSEQLRYRQTTFWQMLHEWRREKRRERMSVLPKLLVDIVELNILCFAKQPGDIKALLREVIEELQRREDALHK